MPVQTAEIVTVNEAALDLPHDLITKGDKLAAQAMAVKVHDSESFTVAAELGKELKLQKSLRLDYFKPVKRILDSLKSNVLGKEKAAVAPIEQALTHLDTTSTAWRREQLQKEEAERERLRKIEQERIEAERKQQIKEAKADGNKKLAEQIKAAPVVVPTPQVQSAIPQVGGLRRRTNWKFRIVNAAAVPREWCVPDEKAIGEFVRDNKEAAKDQIPGIEVYSDEHTI